MPDPVKVLFVEEEDLRDRLGDRFRRTILGRGGLGPDAEFLRFVCRSGFTFASQEWVEALHRVLDEFPAQIIVFDVLRKIFRGDVTTSKDVAPFLQRVDEVRDRHGAAVVLVAHDRKKVRGRREVGAETDDPVEEILGSTDLAAWPDTIVKLTRIGHEEEITNRHLATVQVVSKDGFASPFEVALEGGAGEPVTLSYLGTVKEARDAKSRDQLLGVIRQLRGNGVTNVTVKTLAEVSGLHRQTVTAHLPRLLEAGYLAPGEEKGRWPGYRIEAV